MAAVVTQPIDVVKTRMMTGNANVTAVQCAEHILKTEGLGPCLFLLTH